MWKWQTFSEKLKCTRWKEKSGAVTQTNITGSIILAAPRDVCIPQQQHAACVAAAGGVGNSFIFNPLALSQRVGAVVCQSYAAPLFIPQVLIKGRSGWVVAAAVRALARGRIHPRWRQQVTPPLKSNPQPPPPRRATFGINDNAGKTNTQTNSSPPLLCVCSLSCVAKCYL